MLYKFKFISLVQSSDVLSVWNIRIERVGQSKFIHNSQKYGSSHEYFDVWPRPWSECLFVLEWFISTECNGLKKDLIRWAISCKIEIETWQKHTMEKANATCDNLYMLKEGTELDRMVKNNRPGKMHHKSYYGGHKCPNRLGSNSKQILSYSE